MKKLFNYASKFYSLIREYMTDLYLFARYNSHSPAEDKQRKNFYHIIIKTHTVEKGLSLPEPRPMFGIDKINEILSNLKSYDDNFSRLPLDMAKGALKDYVAFNESAAQTNNAVITNINDWLSSQNQNSTEQFGGTKEFSCNLPQKNSDHIHFLKNRFSCRTFSPDALPADIIETAVQTANKAPSQCNRQSVRLHFYQDKQILDELLLLQGGSRGFNETIGNLFIVTSEITAWGGPQQRNQLYVDGGLYAMMLMLSLQANGICSCPLNLAVNNVMEKKMKLVAEIPERQRLIMMIAAGFSADSTVRVAKSPRLFVEETLTIH